MAAPSTAEVLAYLPLAGALLAEGIDDPSVAAFVHQQHASTTAPDDWESWLHLLFPTYTRHPFGSHHCALWEHVWQITPGERPAPFIGIWARGGAKSTSIELAVAALAARERRRYALYICNTQEQADDHVSNVAMLLESDQYAAHYPHCAERSVNKYGSSKGWRRNRLRTASGFTLDAIGLDTASRGVKLEEQRPDLILFDDIDDPEDSPMTVAKKERALTRSLLPAGTDDVAVLGVQNLIHETGVFARLASGEADYLVDRIVSGPLPAVENLTYEQRAGRTVLVAGEPVWEGQDLAACQRIVDRDGLSSFLIESQHEVNRLEGGTFAHVEFRHCEWDEVPWSRIVRTVVWCDPAVTDKDTSDSNGIQADALADDGMIYRLFSWEQRASPETTLTTAILKAHELGADHVGIETDQGGDVWRPAYQKVWGDLVSAGTLPSERRVIPCIGDKAGAGHGPKVHRATLMLADYERGRFVHVLGPHLALERALKRFPVRKPYDLTDAAYWSWQDVRGHQPAFAIEIDPEPVPQRPSRSFWRG